jgi:LmbE family N-acetylglucosaminyl deacetylase
VNCLIFGLLIAVTAGCSKLSVQEYSSSAASNELLRTCETNSTRSCKGGNGTGSQQCNADGSAFGPCGNLTSCNSGYSLQNAACVFESCIPNASQKCSLGNGTGTQTCNASGSGLGPCGNLSSCEQGYVLQKGSCVKILQFLTGNPSPPPGSLPAVFWVPHQDDEALGFGAAIAEHKQAGRPVYLVLVSNGVNAGLQATMNGQQNDGAPVQCNLTYDYLPDPNISEGFLLDTQALTSLFPGLFQIFLPGQHDPFHHFNLSLEDVVRTRTNEFLASALSMGVDGVFILESEGIDDNRFYNDYENSVTEVTEAIREVMAIFPGASHKFPSGYLEAPAGNTNVTHKGTTEAALRAMNQFGLADALFYRIYTYGAPDQNLAEYPVSVIQPIESSWMAVKQNALLEYAVWAPDHDQYAMGYHSAASLFLPTMTIPYNYIDTAQNIIEQIADPTYQK